MLATDTLPSAGREARSLKVSRVVVPLDGSDFARSALWPASALRWFFKAELELLAVGRDHPESDELARSLNPVADDTAAILKTRVGDNVAGSILEAVAAQEGTLLCMASHGRGRMTGAVLGSVAGALLAEARHPVVLVGPRLDAQRRSLTDGPVLACVDGSPASEAVLPTAARWAKALAVPLGIATVAEPVPPPLDERRYHRMHGPSCDAQAYVDGLAAAWRHQVSRVVPVAIYDPLGPAEGLEGYLQRGRAGLLALTTRGRTGLSRAVLGSRAAEILAVSPVPLLLVPPHDS